jgi:hypothetical protein
MRQMLVATLLVGLLLLSVGCKDEKVVAPKNVPAPPKGPPTGIGAGGAPDKGKATGGTVAP